MKDPANKGTERKCRIKRAALLKQQPEQKNTNWASLEQERARRAACVAAHVAMDR